MKKLMLTNQTTKSSILLILLCVVFSCFSSEKAFSETLINKTVFKEEKGLGSKFTTPLPFLDQLQTSSKNEMRTSIFYDKAFFESKNYLIMDLFSKQKSKFPTDEKFSEKISKQVCGEKNFSIFKKLESQGIFLRVIKNSNLKEELEAVELRKRLHN